MVSGLWRWKGISRKITVDNSEYHAISVANKEKVEMSKMNFIIQIGVFWPAKSISDVIFVSRDQENPVSLEKSIFPDHCEYQMWWLGSLMAGYDGTRSAPSALHFLTRCCNRHYTSAQSFALALKKYSTPPVVPHYKYCYIIHNTNITLI